MATATCKVGRVYIGSSGRTLTVLEQTEAGDLSKVKAVTQAPIISVNKGTSITLADPFVSTYHQGVIWPLAAAVKETDVITFSAPDGWVQTVDGPGQAETNLPVDNRTNKPAILPDDFVPTMKLGLNVGDLQAGDRKSVV